MKINRQTKGTALVAGALAILSAGILVPSAQAKPNKEQKEARKEVRRERRDVRHADTPEEKREERRELRDAKRDLRRERREYRPGYGNGTYRPGYGNGTYRPGSNNGNYNSGYGNSLGASTGEVVNVVSASRVDVRINGRVYNVFLVSRLPRGLNRGDLVRVDGVRRNNNDIHDARVQIVRNR